MKRLINVVLAVALLVGLYGYYNPGFAEDEASNGQEQSVNEGSGEPSGESPSSEEQPPDENKVYACPKCGFTSDGPGDCPACNISLTEGSSGSGESGSDEASETGGDTTAPTGDESGANDSEVTTPPSETEE
ncbi:MAG TPA: hypothetical protein PLU72_10410 [Candidatus Ozemobacteraceae bacterium]|nr:hypothetical protein [Candidatus Ozemobacteraceae bacterium]HQG29478.1 hypothetical protein [Candidatus Ozemobacteraceae bacterium]